MIAAIVCGILALACLIISILQFKEKGFLFNNAYIWASKQERETMDKKPHYRQSAIVFAFLCCTFVLIGLYAIFKSLWLFILAIGLAAIALLYAIISSVKEYLKSKF